MPRRPLLTIAPVLTAASMMLAGCGIVGGEDATPTPTSTSTSTPQPTSTRTATPTQTPTALPTDTPTPLPTDTPVPPPPATQQQPPPSQPPPAGIPLPRGRTMTLRTGPADGAVGARVVFRGDNFPMLADGAGGFWRVVGASAIAQLGDFPAQYTLYDAGGNAVATRSELISVVFTSYPVEYITLPPGQLEGISSDAAAFEANTRASTFAQFTPEKMWDGPFIYPANGPLTANYGDGRSYNGNPVSSYHSGADFGVDEGAPIVAAARGRVAFAGFFASRGNSVLVDHGGGVYTGYHHMSRIDVVAGQEVLPGTQVGAAGATGLATGSHLHWELIVGGVNVDPLFWTQPGVVP